jgi:carotenoid cleavage dioxygenase-like enzyme
MLPFVQVQEVQATVTGQLPAWLSGSLLVNGGGDYSRMKHMFDGYACITKVKVEGGKAWGSQRYLSTEAYKTYQQQGEQDRGLGLHTSTTQQQHHSSTNRMKDFAGSSCCWCSVLLSCLSSFKHAAIFCLACRWNI